MGEINQIKSRKKRGRAMLHTLFALVGIPQLLEPAANLLWRSMFARLLEYIFGYEAVPVRESTKGFGGPGIGGLVARETLRRGV